MSFHQQVPKFLQTMLANNPAVRLQGMKMHAEGGSEGGASGFDAMANSMLIEAATSRPSDSGSKRPPAPPGGRERPDRDDEAPAVANLDDFAAEDLAKLMPALARKREREEAEKAAANEAAAATAAASSSAAAASSAASAAPAAAAAPALTLADARLLHVKRTRVDDAAADQIEAATGKHIFRPAVAPPPQSEKEAGMSAEELARKKRRKKEEAEKAKSRLTFDEQDI